MAKGYAYVDKSGGVLHVINKLDGGGKDQKSVALERCTNGRVVEVDRDFEYGSPLENGRQVLVYGVHECYVDGNRSGGEKLDTERAFPGLAELYGELV